MRHLILTFLLVAGPPALAPAHADQASFVQAFSKICMPAKPSMAGSKQRFVNAGWQVAAGAGPGEFEASKNGTNVFVITADAGMQAGCTVEDSGVSLTRVMEVLNAELATIPPASWALVSDDYGLHWEIYLDDSLIALTVQASMGGEGGAISFEQRPGQ